MSNINQYANEALVINDEDFYDVDFWNGVAYETRKISGLTLKSYFAQIPTTQYIHSSTQWDKQVAIPVALPDGQIANGFTFVGDSDKVPEGTTSYDEYTQRYSRTITLSGTSGTANINVDGTDYLATFNTNLFTTADDWVVANELALDLLGINAYSLSVASFDGRIRFAADDDTILNAITITNVSGDLNGTLGNEFTGSLNAALDHVVIPYVGQPYEGLRIHHAMRINFDVLVGTAQTLALSLRRLEDDSIIGGEIKVTRDNDVEGNQFIFETYTNSATDPFVTGGFYFALRNDSGVSVDIGNSVGILIQNTFQKPVLF